MAGHAQASFHSSVQVATSIFLIFDSVLVPDGYLRHFVDESGAFNYTVDTYGICVFHRRNSTRESLSFLFCLDHFRIAGFFRPKFNILWYLGLFALTAFYSLAESTSRVQLGLSELNLPKTTEVWD